MLYSGLNNKFLLTFSQPFPFGVLKIFKEHKWADYTVIDSFIFIINMLFIDNISSSPQKGTRIEGLENEISRMLNILGKRECDFLFNLLTSHQNMKNKEKLNRGMFINVVIIIFNSFLEELIEENKT